MPPQTNLPKPEPFLSMKVHVQNAHASLRAMCAGYEAGKWRAASLAAHAMEWLPEFALSPSEWKNLQHANAVQLIRRAAKTVYDTDKFRRRGEFGELLLHALVRQTFDSLPAISKIYYKTATNDTVKGFDAVHVVGPPEQMELWLGEAKFYDNISAAIGDVVNELESHFMDNYLRTEFLLIMGKIDDAWPHSVHLKRLLSPNTSLDEVFKRVCIPVLLTYDSPCLAKHSACNAAYESAFRSEVTRNHEKFLSAVAGKGLPSETRLHLFLLPLHTKDALVRELDGRLRIWQQL